MQRADNQSLTEAQSHGVEQFETMDLVFLCELCALSERSKRARESCFSQGTLRFPRNTRDG